MELVTEAMGAVEGQLEAKVGEKRERDAQGRFARGNTYGRGRLDAGRASVVARLMCEAATEEKIREACEKVVDKAAAGGIEAAKLVFRYVMSGWCGAREEWRADAATTEEAKGRGREVKIDLAAADEEVAPSATVETVEAEPSATVGTVEAGPFATVETVEAGPFATVETVEAGPFATVETVEAGPSATVETVEAGPSATVGTEVGPSEPATTVGSGRVLLGKEIAAAKKARYRRARMRWAEKAMGRKRKKSKK